MSQRPSYKNRHFIHEILVYGYDETEKSLDVIGYNFDGIYTTFKYSYDEFNLAFEKGLEIKPDYLKEDIQLIKVRAFYMKYSFDLNRFNTELQNYINSTPDTKKLFYSLADNSTPNYGINVYKEMANYLEYNNKNNIRLRLVNIHFFYEHKSSMLKKFEYIFNNYNTLTKFTDNLNLYFEVEKESNLLRLYCLKQMVNGNSIDKNQLQEYSNSIVKINNKEEKIISEIIPLLNENVNTVS